MVDGGQGAKIIHVVFGQHISERFQVFRLGVVDPTQVNGKAHVVLRWSHVLTGIEIREILTRDERDMRAFITYGHGEGLILIDANEVQSIVRGDIVDPTPGFREVAVYLEGAVKVFPLSAETGRVVKSGSLAALVAHVPFSYKAGSVTGFTQGASPVVHLTREIRKIRVDIMCMRIFSSQERGAARRA